MSCGYLWFRPRASPGFDGWIMLVHEEFETEDQAIYCEKKRLSSIGGVKEEALRAAGVHAELIGLDVDCGIIYNPPDDGDERLWVLDYFKERMIDFVADDELVRQLLHHQEAVHGDQDSEHQDDAPSPPGGVATADDDSLGGGIDSQSPPPPQPRTSRSPPLPPTPATGVSVSLTRRERLRTLWLRTEERAALLLQQRWRALQATEEATSRRLCHQHSRKRRTARLGGARARPPCRPLRLLRTRLAAPGGLSHPGRKGRGQWAPSHRLWCSSPPPPQGRPRRRLWAAQEPRCGMRDGPRARGAVPAGVGDDGGGDGRRQAAARPHHPQPRRSVHPARLVRRAAPRRAAP